jgi:hypothetical protein
MCSTKYRRKLPILEESADVALMKVRLLEILADLLHRSAGATVDVGRETSSISDVTDSRLHVRPLLNRRPSIYSSLSARFRAMPPRFDPRQQGVIAIFSRERLRRPSIRTLFSTLVFCAAQACKPLWKGVSDIFFGISPGFGKALLARSTSPFLQSAGPQNP